MKKLLILLTAFAASTSAFAVKPCEELKAEIAAKIEARGVKAFTLDIVPADQVGVRKVVGSCDGGTKKIVYARK